MVPETRLLLIPKYLSTVYDHLGKADLSKDCLNTKRKLAVTLHFSAVIELEFGQKILDIVLYFILFF